ncbi:MAG TPA: hypothetical protein VGO56_13985 [Pyrinomonadaceae bacterium]|jgi:hypothetical protein|nr:hypothetical protein [Pyrinomonadaceae bacterium]
MKTLLRIVSIATGTGVTASSQPKARPEAEWHKCRLRVSQNRDEVERRQNKRSFGEQISHCSPDRDTPYIRRMIATDGVYAVSNGTYPYLGGRQTTLLSSVRASSAEWCCKS